jgi:hypothetical protein
VIIRPLCAELPSGTRDVDERTRSRPLDIDRVDVAAVGQAEKSQVMSSPAPSES